MAETYFSKMPIISYANTQVRNITERAKIVHSRLVGVNNYTPSELGDDTRADVVAWNIYGDPYMDWLLWLNNNIMDPYYGWHLNEDEFQAHINDTYGSEPIADQLIAYYRTVWPTDTTARVPVSDYLYHIPGSWKKYYQPIFDNNGNVMYYQQAYLDWRMSTNQMLQWNVTMVGNSAPFVANTTVSVVQGGNVVGQAQIYQANSSVVYAQHTSGNTAAPNGLVNMFNANQTATFSNTTILSQNISPEEARFWEPCTYYMAEDERNTLKKYIYILDPATAMQVSTALTNVFAT